MKMKFILRVTLSVGLLLACLAPWMQSQAQETSSVNKNWIPEIRIADNLQLKIGGQFRTEYLFDSRKPIAVLNDLVGFFPANKRLDKNGKDLNNLARSSVSSKGTCINMALTGPDVLNAKSEALIDVDFTGSDNQSVNLCFCRAYIKLNWTKAELLIGKTWNPLGETADPGVPDLAGGTPYVPFGRSEQLRLVLKPVQSLHLWLAGVYKTEQAFATDGDLQSGGADIKNSVLPELHFQLRYVSRNFSAGLVSAYKNIRPRISVGENPQLVESTLSSYALGGFVDFKANQFKARAGLTIGQNMGEYLMLGGYAVKEADANGIPSYTPLNVAAYWAFIGYSGKHWSPGVFFGYTQNNGFEDELKNSGERRTIVSGPIDAFDVAKAYRIAPSLKYSVGRLGFHAELEYNVAAYGTEFDKKLKATKSENVGAIRFRLIASLSF
jgi:hypothetical protein